MWQKPTQRCKTIFLQLETKKDDSLDMLSKPQRMPPPLGGQGRAQGLELRPCGQALTAPGSGREGSRVQAQAGDTYREWLGHLTFTFLTSNTQISLKTLASLIKEKDSIFL